MEIEASFFESQLTSQKPIYFIHPHNKYWQVQVNEQNVAYRAGKLKNQAQITSQKLEKKYSNDYAAKRTVKEKIRQKMVKGYILIQGSIPEKALTLPVQSKNQQQNQNKKQRKLKINEQGSGKSKKQQKQQKKKIKSLIKSLDSKTTSNSINQSNSVQNVESFLKQNQTIIQQAQTIKSKFQAITTLLLNAISGEGIKYQVIQERKIQITKYLQRKNCGYQVRSFQTKQETMKFLFGEREWMKSQGYQQIEAKQADFMLKNDNCTIIQQKQQTKVADSSKIQQQKKAKYQGLVKTELKKKRKPKGDSLVQQTDESLGQVKKLIFFDNQPNNNKEEPMLGPPSQGMAIKLMLAQTWKQGADPKGWIMSQKLDGVRCYWTGTEMYSRNGNKFVFPNFFTKNWPKAQLDGELFIGRGKFSHTMSAVKRLAPINVMWQQVRYLVFDTPGLVKVPFKQRYRIMKQVIGKSSNPYIKCHFHRECGGFQDLFKQLDHINKVQGEGLMLRDPNSIYEFRRSKALMKVKTFHDDQATILGYNQGTGRFVGHVGSLKCVNKAGAYFDVGSGLNDEMRFNPPKVGQKIVYKYQQLNKDTGRPRFPTFLRMFQDEAIPGASAVMGWVKDGQQIDQDE